MSTRRDHFVYRMYDADGRLLYIGCTKNLRTRWNQHRARRPALSFAAVKFKVQEPYTKKRAYEIELAALRTEAPLLGQARRTPEQQAEHLEAERLFTSVPHKDGPVMRWHRFLARPLEGFEGFWRVFSFGRPTCVISDAEIRADEWSLA